MRPPGRRTRASSAKNGRELDEVAQGEAAGDAVHGAVGEREARGRRPAPAGRRCGRRRACRRTGRRRWLGSPARSRSMQRSPVPAARSRTSDPGPGGSEGGHRPPAPADVEAERHDPVDEVVAGSDGVEHRPHGFDLLLALGEVGPLPRAIARCVRRVGRGGGCGRHASTSLASPTVVRRRGGSSAPSYSARQRSIRSRMAAQRSGPERIGRPPHGADPASGWCGAGRRLGLGVAVEEEVADPEQRAPAAAEPVGSGSVGRLGLVGQASAVGTSLEIAVVLTDQGALLKRGDHGCLVSDRGLDGIEPPRSCAAGGGAPWRPARAVCVIRRPAGSASGAAPTTTLTRWAPEGFLAAAGRARSAPRSSPSARRGTLPRRRGADPGR